MRYPDPGTIVIFCAAVCLYQSSSKCLAQYAWFSRSTDVIAVSGQTDLSEQCTIEAVFLLPTSQHSGGSLFDEWVLEDEEKYLGISVNRISAVAYPNDLMEASEQRGLITLGTWHHVAFVCNGTEQRIYLDGLRIQSVPAPQRIGNGSGQAFIGYAPRNGSDFPSFVGFLDSIRVSNVARYAGLSFTAPSGDLSSDQNTVLLYNFNDATNSMTVLDESPLGRTGTLGTGYHSATAPKIVGELPSEAPLGLQIFPAVELQFSTSRNVEYQLQSSRDMEVWSDLPEFITGDGSVMTKLISIQGTSRLFYRVVARQ